MNSQDTDPSSRRKFIKTATALTAFGLFSDWAAVASPGDKIGEVLPLRRIIRNGEKTTAFALGGYHAGLPDDPSDGQRIIERAVELGVRFFDNARVYQQGRAEEYYGRFLTPKYRDQIFLMTKSVARTASDAWKDFELSSKALNTDHLDLWQMHTLTTREDARNRLDGGVVDAFLEAKEQGKTRYIGFTSHQNPSTIIYFLEELKKRGLEMDTCQMPLNVCDPHFESFQKHAIPALLEGNYGIIAMKTMAGGSMMGKRIDTTPRDLKTEDIPNVVEKAGITYAELHQYVYGLPISSLCSGCDTVDKLEANVSVLRSLKKLTKADMAKLEARVKPWAGYNVENYKRVFG